LVPARRTHVRQICTNKKGDAFSYRPLSSRPIWFGCEFGCTLPSSYAISNGFTSVFIRAITGYARASRKIFAKMRDMGVRGILVYCADYQCSHSIAISGDVWPDHVRLSDI
jgi:hypothetical protein